MNYSDILLDNKGTRESELIRIESTNSRIKHVGVSYLLNFVNRKVNGLEIEKEEFVRSYASLLRDLESHNFAVENKNATRHHREATVRLKRLVLTLYYASGDCEYDIVDMLNKDFLSEYRRVIKNETAQLTVNDMDRFTSSIKNDVDYYMREKVWNEKLLLLIVARYLLEHHFSHDFEFIDKIIYDYWLHATQENKASNNIMNNNIDCPMDCCESQQPQGGNATLPASEILDTLLPTVDIDISQLSDDHDYHQDTEQTGPIPPFDHIDALFVNYIIDHFYTSNRFLRFGKLENPELEGSDISQTVTWDDKPLSTLVPANCDDNLMILSSLTQNGKSEQIVALTWFAFFKDGLGTVMLCRNEASAYQDWSLSIKTFNEKLAAWFASLKSEDKEFGKRFAHINIKEYYVYPLSNLHRGARNLRVDDFKKDNKISCFMRIKLLVANNVQKLCMYEFQVFRDAFGEDIIPITPIASANAMVDTIVEEEHEEEKCYRYRLKTVLIVDEAQNSYFGAKQLCSALNEMIEMKGIFRVEESVKESVKSIVTRIIDVTATAEVSLFANRDKMVDFRYIPIKENYYGVSPLVSNPDRRIEIASFEKIVKLLLDHNLLDDLVEEDFTPNNEYGEDTEETIAEAMAILEEIAVSKKRSLAMKKEHISTKKLKREETRQQKELRKIELDKQRKQKQEMKADRMDWKKRKCDAIVKALKLYGIGRWETVRSYLLSGINFTDFGIEIDDIKWFTAGYLTQWGNALKSNSEEEKLSMSYFAKDLLATAVNCNSKFSLAKCIQDVAVFDKLKPRYAEFFNPVEIQTALTILMQEVCCGIASWDTSLAIDSFFKKLPVNKIEERIKAILGQYINRPNMNRFMQRYTWWSGAHDANLLIGVFKHGYAQYDQIQKDETLIFKKNQQEIYPVSDTLTATTAVDADTSIQMTVESKEETSRISHQQTTVTATLNKLINYFVAEYVTTSAYFTNHRNDYSVENLTNLLIAKESTVTASSKDDDNDDNDDDMEMKCDDNNGETGIPDGMTVKEESTGVDVDAPAEEEEEEEEAKPQMQPEPPKEDPHEGVKPLILKTLFKASATISKIGLKYLKYRLCENPSLPTEHFLFLVSVKGNTEMNALAESFLLDTADVQRPIITVMAYSSCGLQGPAIIFNKYTYQIFQAKEKTMESYARDIISTLKHNYLETSVIDIHSDVTNPNCIYFRFPRTAYFRLRTQLSIVDAIFQDHKYLVVTMGNKLLREGITPKTYNHKLAANGMFYCDTWLSFKTRPIVDVIQRVGRICGTRPDNDPKPDIFMIHEVKTQFQILNTLDRNISMAMLEYGDDFIVQDALSYISGKTDNIVIRPKISVKELCGGSVTLKPSITLRKYYNSIFYTSFGESTTIGGIKSSGIHSSQDQKYFPLVLKLLQTLRKDEADNNDEAYEAMTAESVFKQLVGEGTLFDRDDEDDEDYSVKKPTLLPKVDSHSSSAQSRGANEQDIINFLTTGDDSEFNENKKKMAIDFLNNKWFPWLYQLATNSNKKKTTTGWIQVNPASSQEIRPDTTMLIGNTIPTTAQQQQEEEEGEKSSSSYMLRVIKPIDVEQVKVFCRCRFLSIMDQTKSPGDSTIADDDNTTVASGNDGSVLDSSSIMTATISSGSILHATPKTQRRKRNSNSFFTLPARVEGKNQNVGTCQKCGIFVHNKCHVDLLGCCNCFQDNGSAAKQLFGDNEDENDYQDEEN